MSGHAPGPWTVKKSKSGFPADVVTVSKNPYGSQTFVAHAYGPLANARLIAAAPEMLEVLKSIEWVVSGTSPFCADCGRGRVHGHSQQCRLAAAIAKAEGSDLTPVRTDVMI